MSSDSSSDFSNNDLIKTRVRWGKTHRLVSSSFPPVDLFEDIADPRDWDLLCAAESKTNPRLSESVGNLDLVAPERRVSGVGASAVMAPFTHISIDWQGRFHDGSYGAYYAGDSFETSLFEVAHHRALFFASTNEDAGWIADQRELVGKIDHELVDIRGAGLGDNSYSHLLDADDFKTAQAFALNARKAGADGIVYPSIRYPKGECFVAFYPDVVSIPKQGKHIGLHWNGARIDKIKVYQSPQNLVYEIDE